MNENKIDETTPKKSPSLSKEEVRKELLNPHNSRGRGRSAAEIRASYARYYQNKKKAFDLESRNFQFLVLWPASDKDTNPRYQFYNMGGNSAIMYVFEYAPRMKRKAALRVDMDNGEVKFKTGICSIAKLDVFEKKLAELGIKRIAATKGYEDLVIFKLGREFSKSEIREMMKLEQVRLDKLNKTIYASVAYPDIHRQIIDLKRIIPTKVKNMDKTYREVVGMKMIDSLMVLIRAYSAMAHGDMAEYAAAKQMVLESDMILAEVSLMNELQLWDVSTSIRMAEIVVGLKQLVKARIINKVEREADEAKGRRGQLVAKQVSK